MYERDKWGRRYRDEYDEPKLNWSNNNNPCGEIKICGCEVDEDCCCHEDDNEETSNRKYMLLLC